MKLPKIEALEQQRYEEWPSSSRQPSCRLRGIFGKINKKLPSEQTQTTQNYNPACQPRNVYRNNPAVTHIAKCKSDLELYFSFIRLYVFCLLSTFTFSYLHLPTAYLKYHFVLKCLFCSAVHQVILLSFRGFLHIDFTFLKQHCTFWLISLEYNIIHVVGYITTDLCVSIRHAAHFTAITFLPWWCRILERLYHYSICYWALPVEHIIL